MKKSSAVLRASVMLGMIGVLTTGVTYAALQSSATLTDNTISTATAGLLVDGPDEDGEFNESEEGFSFTDLVPGGDWSEAQEFSLQNDGGTNLKLSVHAMNGELAEEDDDGLDESKVFVRFTSTDDSDDGGIDDDDDDDTTEVLNVDDDDDDNGNQSKTYTLAQLESRDNKLPHGLLGHGDEDDTKSYDVQVRLGNNAIDGDGTNGDDDSDDDGEEIVSEFDLVFTGEATNREED